VTDVSREHVTSILGSKSKPSKKPAEAGSRLSLPLAFAGSLLGFLFDPKDREA
jgi:hypothetical protein